MSGSRSSLCVRAGLAAVALVALCGSALASSHREAPQVTESPKIDSTDFYMFTSYEAGRSDFVTIVANYQPFQAPYGGPNFFQMDPDALYQIHIDNNGDAREDITFTFRFTNRLRDIAIPVGNQSVSIPLYNASAVGPAADANAGLNILKTYTVDVTFGDQFNGRSVRCTNFDTGSETFMKPADNVGAKTFSGAGGYEAYARNHITRMRIPGARAPSRVFVGQRKDPFVVNLGETFDLVNFNPLGPENGKADSLAEDNCTAICIEIPKAFLRGNPNTTVIGAWTTASLPKNRAIRFNPMGFNNATEETGAWRQVSRLSMPLVNELVIGLKDKDTFSSSRPRNDGQFATYVTNPTLPALLSQLFSVPAPTLPRNDLVSVFLTGVPGLNQPPSVRPAEMMRLNLTIPPVAKGAQSRLGVLGNDLAGFPNGRRPGDDVVDIELRAVMGALYPDAGQSGGNAPVGNLAFTDGAFLDDSFFDNVFPYLRTPVASSPNLATP